VIPVQQARWTFTLYPEAGEGGGCFQPALRRPAVGGGAPDVERSEQEASRRARAKLRRYIAANRLNRFATLTYVGEGCFDHQQLRTDGAEFFKGLRRELGRKPLPYAWAPEWHPGGHGLHVHFAVGRYVRQSLIKDVWGRGIVHIKLISDLPVGSGPLEEARLSLLGRSEEAVLADACEVMGGVPSQVWRSADREGWRGPPAYWCGWPG
jgi:hypothetical protein